MKISKLAVLACAAAAMGAAAAAGRPHSLLAQVIRCYDVVCVKDADGKLRCVEKLVTCPPEPY
jgi:hypothetical protein